MAPSVTTNPGPLTVAQVAKFLSVHRSMVNRLVGSGEFPNAIRVGRNVRIPQSDLDAFIERNRVKPAPAPSEVSEAATRSAIDTNVSEGEG